MYAGEASPSTPSKRKSTVFNSLDQFIDAYTLAEYIRGLNNPNKRRRCWKKIFPFMKDRDMTPEIMTPLENKRQELTL